MPFGSEPLSANHHAELQGLTILAVEDHPDSLELLTEALAALGAIVFPAATSQQAFQLLREHRPQLVVSDIGLPDEDGCSLMRRIRALSAEEGGNTPSIAVSAFTSAEDRARARAAGFQAFVAKPMDLAQLKTRIRTLVPPSL